MTALGRGERTTGLGSVPAGKRPPPFYVFLWRRLRLPLVTLVCVNIMGAAGYHALLGWSWSDSFFMTITTVTSVGYGEIQPLDGVGRVFTSGLILLGVGAIAYSGFMLGRVLLEEEFSNLMRGRKMQREIDRLTGHVIVCGYGRCGRQAVDNLRAAGMPVVAIDVDEKKADQSGLPPVYYIRGDATDEGLLEQTGIARAKAVITALPKDTDNVFVVLTAREMNPSLTIVARATEEGSISKLRRAGAHRVISSDAIGGRRMADVILRPTVVEFLNALTGGETGILNMEEFRVRGDSAVVGKSLRDWSIRARTGANIVGIKRGSEPIVINPDADTRLAAEDILIAVGRAEDLKRLVEFI
jgi:voltage-gated potassium channel